MAPQSSIDTNFGKGLYANVNRFDQPQGSVPRISNYVFTRRGALQTVDGSLIVSSLSGSGPTTGQSPFKFITLYAKTGSSAATLALQVSASQVLLIDVTGASYSGSLGTITSTYATPNAVQFGDLMLIASGAGTGLYSWDGTSLTAISNTWTIGDVYSPWVKGAPVQQGGVVVPTVSNGHVYVAIVGGQTGTTEPTWPTGTGATVVDDAGGGTATWQESGPTTPSTPNAAFVFNHLGFAWAWGTAATYNANGIVGPDGIAQSDLNLPASWNPLFTAFAGKGDGTVAMGGAVFTLGEAGIAATAQLVLFKNKSTYVVNGAFPTVTIQRAISDVGCVAPNTIQFIIELGIVRLTHKGIAVFNGQSDSVDQFTDPIREYLFGGAADITAVDWSNIALSCSAQTINPPGYLLAVPLNGAVVRMFFYDLILQCWTVVDLPWSIGTLAFLPNTASAQAQTLTGGASDGTVRQIFNGSADWDGTAITSTVRSPEVGSPTIPTYLRRMNIRAQQAVSGTTASITSVTINQMGRTGKITSASLLSPESNRQTASIGVHRTVLSANFDITTKGPVLLEALEFQSVAKAPTRIGLGGSIASTASGGNVPSIIYAQFGTVSVTAGAFSVAVVFVAPSPPDPNYKLSGSPSWNTDFWYASKTTGGFTVNFNTAAPTGGGTFDWKAEE